MSISDHLKHRLNPKTIAKEVFNHITDKVIPQGADELANVLYSHSAYLPWPGSSGPKPITPSEEPSYADLIDQAAEEASKRGRDDQSPSR